MIDAGSAALHRAGTPPPTVVAITAHARTVSSADRERLAADLAAVIPAGSVILTTCHRVEAYAAAVGGGRAAGMALDLPTGTQVLDGDAAVRHLVSVAAGRDSVVAGEDEILHQMREALDAARRSAGVDPVIDRAFTAALRAGRQARSWLQGPRRSLGDVAVDAIRARRGDLTGRSVLIVGAGKMATIAARCAVRAGASVIVANRSRARAEALAAAVAGGAVDADPGAAIGATVNAVIVALGGRWRIAEPTGDALVAGDAIVVDLSFPPAVPPSLAERLGHRLVTADALAADGATMGSGFDDRGTPGSRIERLIEHAVTEFAEWAGRADARATAQALIRHADAERRRELDLLWRRFPDLDPEARAGIEGMTRHLAERLLQAPLERLGRDPDGRDGQAVREIFAL